MAFVPASAETDAQHAAYSFAMHCAKGVGDTKTAVAFWDCAKTGLSFKGMDPQTSYQAVLMGDYCVKLHQLGQSTDKELYEQLIDVIMKATQ